MGSIPNFQLPSFVPNGGFGTTAENAVRAAVNQGLRGLLQVFRTKTSPVPVRPSDQFTVSAFLSQIAQAGGVARQNRYRVVINTANVRGKNPEVFQDAGIVDSGPEFRLSFFCDKAEFPSREFATSDVRHYGPTYKQPWMTVYPDLPLQFLVGDDMQEKYFFDAWMYAIDNPVSQDMSFLKDYVADIFISQMSDEPDTTGNSKTYTMRFYDAWPIAIGSMQLDYSADNTPHRLPVVFTYRRWVNDVEDVESGSAISPGQVNLIKGDSLSNSAFQFTPNTNTPAN